MNPISRGIRNAFRNGIRTFSIIIILGISIGLALSMMLARQAVTEKINTVKSSMGNTITISPAGIQGFQGGGEPLTSDELSKISLLPNVTSVTETLNDRLTSTNTSLVSAIQPGSFGNRQANNSGVDFSPPPDESRTNSGQQQITRTFTPPVVITGANITTDKSVFSGNNPSFISGANIDGSKDADVAVIGKALAEKNNLSLGSSFTAYGTQITVKGIYDTGNTFANSGLVMPLVTVQRLSGQTGAVTSATVNVDSIDNIDSSVTAIKSILGDKADVVSNQTSAAQIIAPLQNVKTISLYSFIGALFASSIIILLTMMMIVRERRREIGVMKAIGSTNSRIMFQFICEAITLTVIGLIVGLVIGIAAANPITNALVTNSTSTSQTTQGSGRSASPGGPQGGGLRGFGANSVTNVGNVKTAVGIDILGYGILAALGIAIIGSAIPAYFISKVRPADVMRAE